MCGPSAYSDSNAGICTTLEIWWKQTILIEGKEERRETILIEEENTIRYVGGFVVMKRWRCTRVGSQ